MSIRKTTVLLIVMDVLTTLAVFNLVAFLRGVPGGSDFLVQPLLIPTAVVLLSVYLIEGYKAQTDMLSADYASLHTIAVTCAMGVTLMLTYVFIPHGYELQSSRLVIAISHLALIPITLGYRRIIYLRRISKRELRPIVFLGDGASFQTLREEFSRMRLPQPLIDAGPSGDPGSSLATGPAAPTTIKALLDDISTDTIRAEAIVLRESSDHVDPEISRKLVELYFAGIPTYTLERFHQIYWRKIPLYRLNQAWLFQEGFRVAREPVFERLKRLSDIVLALTGLMAGVPFVLVAAAAIWMEDRGAVFFTQVRVGKNGRPFRLVKLRTMRPGSDASPYTQPGDTRVTRVGRLLRTTRIDELPQLWNVLRGEMSLIGPRAEWDRLVAGYEREIPCYHFRHLVKPGITGWAQVNYPYGASLEDTIRKLEYDLYYIRHFSFLLDASIVLKTIHIMLFGKGR